MTQTTRLSKLEKAFAPRKERAVIGVYDPDNYGETVKVQGSARITKDDWKARYPDGILLTVVHDLLQKSEALR